MDSNKSNYTFFGSDELIKVSKGAKIDRSYMSAHVFLNILYNLGTRDKMRGFLSILLPFRNKFNKLNNTGAQMLDSISITLHGNYFKSHFWCEKVKTFFILYAVLLRTSLPNICKHVNHFRPNICKHVNHL